MATENLFPKIGELATKADEETKLDEAGGDDEDKVIQEIDSLCMNCHEQGTTRLMLTSIPYFREIIVMSFRCEHCGASNNEIQAASTIQPEGQLYTAKILDRSDLDRQIVRSPNCEIVISEYQLTLPPTNRGQLTTVEGLIRDVVTDLSLDQPLRRVQDEAGYQSIEALLEKLKEILGDDDEEEEQSTGKVLKASDKAKPMPAFTIKLDDPSGNSWIEFIGSMNDPKWNLRVYPRTLEQNVALGLVAQEEPQEEEAQQTEDDTIPDDEILVFHGHCSSCGHALDTKMKRVNIPYFKEVLIMSTNCDRCGYRDNEVKSGAAISEKGKKIILKVEDKEDLSRDILKSETAGLTIPEIDLVLTHGTLGGRFTTLEGILNQVFEELSEKAYIGDAATADDKLPFQTFLSNLKDVKEAARPFTVILDDPLANSYMQSLYAPDPDPNMTIELYDRTWEQDEELGLNDIQVEGYEGEPVDAGNSEEKKEPTAP